MEIDKVKINGLPERCVKILLSCLGINVNTEKSSVTLRNSYVSDPDFFLQKLVDLKYMTWRHAVGLSASRVYYCTQWGEICVFSAVSDVLNKKNCFTCKNHVIDSCYIERIDKSYTHVLMCDKQKKRATICGCEFPVMRSIYIPVLMYKTHWCWGK